MHDHPETVRLGASIRVRSSDGESETYVVVSPADADPRTGKVSSHSPVGRALLGRRVGEAVVIPAPGGSFTVRIEAVQLSPGEPQGQGQA